MGNRPVDLTAADGDRSLVDRVHSAMREAILAGTYAPGSRLIVPRIAAEHGVSPIPVREAIRRLESERLVIVERNRGATVTPISVEDLRDIYETRIVIECDALRRAHPHIDEAVLDRARSELVRMTELLHAGDEVTAFVHHCNLHFRLYEPSGSAWSLHLIRQLWTGAERYLRLSPGLRAGPDEFAAEHEAVLAAVRDGTAEEAAAFLEAHLRRTADQLDGAYGVVARLEAEPAAPGDAAAVDGAAAADGAAPVRASGAS